MSSNTETELETCESPAFTVELAAGTPDDNEAVYQEKYARLFELSPVGFLTLTPAGSILEINPYARHLLHVSDCQVPSVEAAMHLLVSDDSQASLERHLVRCIETGQLERCTLRARGDGQMPLLRMESRCVRVDDADVLLCTVTDISPQHDAERALSESERKYRAIFRDNPQGIMVVQTGDMRFLSANNAFCQMLGYTETELLHYTVAELTAPEDYEAEMKATAELIEKKKRSFSMRKRFRRKTGDLVWTKLTGSIIHDSRGKPLFGVGLVEDITEKVLAEEERKRLDTQIQWTQKLESLGILAGGIAHDFNNILMAILGNADVALQEIPEASHAARQRLEEILVSARKATNLTRQLLAYTGRAEVSKKNLDISWLISDMRPLLQTAVSKKAELHFELHKNLPPCEVDIPQIEQVLMNLAMNASDAIGDRPGTITFRTMVEEKTPLIHIPDYELSWLPPGPYVAIESQDTGCGMDRQTIQRIFEPFFTTKSTGRGLGLSAVLGILKAHQGGISVSSQVGKGTTFRVLLPAQDRRKLQAESQKVSLPKNWRGHGTILLVDDEMDVRIVGRRMLERLGFEVIEAANGKEALAVFKEKQQSIACVILDLTMPHMNGEESMAEILRLNAKAKVIMSSGYTERELNKEELSQRSSGFIQKPYRLNDLATTLWQALEPPPAPAATA